VWYDGNFDATWIYICGLCLPANLYAPFDGHFFVSWEIPGVSPPKFKFSHGGQAIGAFFFSFLGVLIRV